MPETSPYMTRQEAADHLRVSVRTFDRYARARGLRKHHVGGVVLYERADVLGLVSAE